MARATSLLTRVLQLRRHSLLRPRGAQQAATRLSSAPPMFRRASDAHARLLTSQLCFAECYVLQAAGCVLWDLGGYDLCPIMQCYTLSIHLVSWSRRLVSVTLGAGTSSTWQERRARAMLLCSSSVKRRCVQGVCVCAMDVLCGGRVTQGAGHGGRGGHARAKERHCADRGGDAGHFGVEQKQRWAESLDGCVSVSYRANPYVKGL